MALTYTESFQTIIGDRRLGVGYLTHDSSDTTVAIPCDTIDYAQILSQVGTNSTSTTCSWSGHTLTVSGVAASGRTDYVIWIGI